MQLARQRRQLSISRDHASKGQMQTSGQPVEKLQNSRGFRLKDGLHHQLAGTIQNYHRDRCRVNF